MIFNTVFVSHFQKYLNGRTEVEIGYLTTSKTGGATPLVIACRNGHYDIAYYLLHNIGIDCEQTGSGEDFTLHYSANQRNFNEKQFFFVFQLHLMVKQ